MVFQIEGQTARLKEVTLGVRERGMVHVRAGLKAGDIVVRTGTHKLHDGDLVSIQHRFSNSLRFPLEAIRVGY